MWKDFFYYSKLQRVVTILIIMIMLSSVIIMIFLFSKSKSIQTNRPTAEIDSFLVHVKEKQKEYKKFSFVKRSKTIPTLFEFDPNTVDSMGMVKLGMPGYIAHNIIKYRNNHGIFKSKEQLKKIYGMKAELYASLLPYINISPKYLPQMVERKDTLIVDNDSVKFYKYPKGTTIDINLADTVELKKIPGIGSGIAKMIIYYRNQLGGFYSINQLDEIKYINKELKSWFFIGVPATKKININRASLERMRMHPYINFYQARAIIEYRKKRGEIKNLSQLSLLDEFTEKDLLRLSNYVVFN